MPSRETCLGEWRLSERVTYELSLKEGHTKREQRRRRQFFKLTERLTCV